MSPRFSVSAPIWAGEQKKSRKKKNEKKKEKAVKIVSSKLEAESASYQSPVLVGFPPSVLCMTSVASRLNEPLLLSFSPCGLHSYSLWLTLP